jgi:hypothetical protein
MNFGKVHAWIGDDLRRVERALPAEYDECWNAERNRGRHQPTNAAERDRRRAQCAQKKFDCRAIKKRKIMLRRFAD